MGYFRYVGNDCKLFCSSLLEMSVFWNGRASKRALVVAFSWILGFWSLFFSVLFCLCWVFSSYFHLLSLSLFLHLFPYITCMSFCHSATDDEFINKFENFGKNIFVLLISILKKKNYSATVYHLPVSAMLLKQQNVQYFSCKKMTKHLKLFYI